MNYALVVPALFVSWFVLGALAIYLNGVFSRFQRSISHPASEKLDLCVIFLLGAPGLMVVVWFHLLMFITEGNYLVKLVKKIEALGKGNSK